MCGICGCSEHIEETMQHVHANDTTILAHNHNQDLNHIHIEKNILAKNDEFAQINKKYFLEKNILTLNMMSSPGSGKTTLLTKTISDLKDKMQSAVIVGDQQTDH